MMRSYEVESLNLIYVFQTATNILQEKLNQADFDPEENKECILNVILAIKDILCFGLRVSFTVNVEGLLWKLVLKNNSSLTKSFKNSIDTVNKISGSTRADGELLLIWICDCWLKKLIVKIIAAMMSKKFSFINNYEEYSIMKGNERRIFIDFLKILEKFTIYFDTLMLDYNTYRTVNLVDIFPDTNLDNTTRISMIQRCSSFDQKSMNMSLCTFKSPAEEEKISVESKADTQNSANRMIKYLQDEVSQLRNELASLTVQSSSKIIPRDRRKIDSETASSISNLENLLKTTQSTNKEMIEKCDMLTKDLKKRNDEIEKLSNETCLYSQLNLKLSSENEYLSKKIDSILHDFGRYGEKVKVISETNDFLNDKITFYESPRWLSDKDVRRCLGCSILFSTTIRRHHCRRCGKIYCKNCCFQFIPLIQDSPPCRTCEGCARIMSWHRSK